jgi:hypothetical protein
MAAPRPKKKTVVKKKPPAKKTPKPKKPSFLRKDTPRPARDIKPGDLRSQTLANDNTPRPAKDLNKGGLRAKFLQDASKGSGVAKGLIKKIPVVGAAAGFIIDSSPAGTGSTVPGQAQKAVQKKMKREIRQGPKLAVTGVKEGIRGSTTYLSSKAGSGRPEYPSSNRGKKASAIMPKISMSGGGVNNPSGKSSGEALRRAGAGTYTASYDVKARKATTSNTAATAAAAGSGGGSGGGSSTAAVKKGRSRPQTRTQRDSLAMEQKGSSGKPKKSILSLFRKG